MEDNEKYIESDVDVFNSAERNFEQRQQLAHNNSNERIVSFTDKNKKHKRRNSVRTASAKFAKDKSGN